MKVAVTVTPKTPGRYEAVARAKAATWGVPFVERGLKSPIEPFFEQFDAVLVLGGKGWTLHDRSGELTFSPGLGLVRIRRRATGIGGEDLLIRLLELKAGDTLFDGTVGLAADAVVCEDVVGPAGRVIGVEGSLPLYLLVSEGLRAMGSQIELRHDTVKHALQQQGTGSVDCVMLDPMFEQPQKASPSFEILRRFALHEPLDAETLHEARRVARRWVVVKGGRRGKDFVRLGIPTAPLMHRNSPVLWGRLPPL